MLGRQKSKSAPLHPNRIAELRIAAGLRQEDLAEKLHMAVSTLGALERGSTRLKAAAMRQIAKELGCHPLELLPDGEGIGARERTLLQLFSAMTPEQQDQFIRVGSALAEPPGPGWTGEPANEGAGARGGRRA